jgi:hypothetical protein
MAINFQEARPALLDSGPYATVDELLEQDDLPECDLTIPRWHKNGKPLKLRVKALTLEQQDSIQMASLVKHPKTGEWITNRELFCAETLTRSVRMPGLDPAHGKALVRKNPVTISAIVDFIWVLAAMTDEELERAATAMAPPERAAADGADPGAIS